MALTGMVEIRPLACDISSYLGGSASVSSNLQALSRLLGGSDRFSLPKRTRDVLTTLTIRNSISRATGQFLSLHR